jgi:hypothetical protein
MLAAMPPLFRLLLQMMMLQLMTLLLLLLMLMMMLLLLMLLLGRMSKEKSQEHNSARNHTKAAGKGRICQRAQTSFLRCRSSKTMDRSRLERQQMEKAWRGRFERRRNGIDQQGICAEE